MAKQRPLDLVQAWIAARKEKDLYSNTAVHHLHSLYRTITAWLPSPSGLAEPHAA